MKPEGELEEMIANIWQQVLGVKQIGRDSNFFDLGGHSLAMVKIHERLQAALRGEGGSKELSLIELFEHPTITALASHIRRGGNREMTLDNVRVRARKQKGASNRHRVLKDNAAAKSVTSADVAGGMD